MSRLVCDRNAKCIDQRTAGGDRRGVLSSDNADNACTEHERNKLTMLQKH